MAEYLIQDNILTETAEAIRTKTGKSEKIKPVDFASKILSIVTDKKIGFLSGDFTATSANMTIQHNAGVIPDFVFVYLSQANSTKNVIDFCSGFSSAMMEVLGEEAQGILKLQNNMAINIKDGLDKHTDNMLGELNNLTETSFNLGSSNFPLATNSNYNWYVITGLV